jgi:hypothetical protein
MTSARWAVLLTLLCFCVPWAAKAQVSVYGEFSTSDFHNLANTNYLSGVTTGILFEAFQFAHRLQLSGDVQGQFVAGSGEHFDGITVGPRVSAQIHRFGGLAPYGEFMLGFARFHGNAATAVYNGANNNQTTDGIWQANAGVAKRLSPRWDLVADYSYSQYYAYGGQYNPKTFSLGAAWHFVKR